jgi:hypothetical protein
LLRFGWVEEMPEVGWTMAWRSRGPVAEAKSLAVPLAARYGTDRLLELAAAVDPGLDELVFADMLDTLARLTNEEIPAPVAQVPTIRAFAVDWAAQLRGRQNGA